MNCNCNNKNNSMKETKIKHVFGNVLRIAIPLTLRTVELVDVDVDGEIEQQAQVTDTDFIPSSDYPVNVVFNKGAVKVSLTAQMRDGNIAYVEDKGKISVGTYDITVTCNDNDGNPYRFKQNTILQVVDATEDAGIETPIEYEVTTWYLDAAIYLVMKGEDGVGIEDIITESSGEIGGINTVTFVLTNGETRSFTILNGSGSVDSDFDENSLHPLSNSVITNKFKSIDANIAGLFGDVDYDSSSKILRFWDITKSTILATIDARPFVKDGMVNRVYIQNRTLVITFNTDSGHDTIAISLDSVFNPNNYYTRSQIDNKFEDVKDMLSLFVHVTARNGSFSSTIDFGTIKNAIAEDNREVIVCVNRKTYYNLYDVGDDDVRFFNIWYESEEDQFYNLLSVNSDNEWSIEESPFGTGGSGGGYTPPQGGIPKTDLAPAVQTSLNKADTALQSSDLEGYATTDDVDDAVAALVSSAPQTLDTLKELADALGDDPNFATTMATQLGNKVDKETGKGLSTNDYTTAEKTKLAELENYDDSALQTAIDGKVDKESGKSLMTDAERTKLQGIAAGAEVNVQPNWTQTNTSADDYIKNKPTLATVATSGSYNDLSNKPTIPDTSTLATKTELNAKQDKINDLASIRINSGKGVADISSNADGTVVTTLANGDTYTIDLNHEHPQYVESDDLADVATSGSYNDLTNKPTIPAAYDDTTLSGRVSALENAGFITTETDPTVPAWAKASTKPTYTAQEVGALPASTTIPTKVSDLTNDSGFTSNAGTITGITMNGASKGTSGVVDLGTVITTHQDISGKANASEMAVNTSGDQTTITLKTGTSATVINQHQSLSGYAKYVLLADDAAYEALSTKDSGTLYLIPES